MTALDRNDRSAGLYQVLHSCLTGLQAYGSPPFLLIRELLATPPSSPVLTLSLPLYTSDGNRTYLWPQKALDTDTSGQSIIAAINTVWGTRLHLFTVGIFNGVPSSTNFNAAALTVRFRLFGDYSRSSSARPSDTLSGGLNLPTPFADGTGGVWTPINPPHSSRPRHLAPNDNTTDFETNPFAETGSVLHFENQEGVVYAVHLTPLTSGAVVPVHGIRRIMAVHTNTSPGGSYPGNAHVSLWGVLTSEPGA